jgi:hypothetical protein
MWQSERRGAQKDADLAALAGALELVPQTQSKTDAEQQAIDTANVNDEAGNAVSPSPGGNKNAANTVVVDKSCFQGNRYDSVTVNLDHNSRTLFSGIFGVNIAPDIGAHARACVGSLNNPSGLRPFILDIQTSPCFVAGRPNFGAECTMDFGSQGGSGGANRGIADIEVPDGACSNVGGDGDVQDMITFGGSNVRCSTQTGNTCPNLQGYPNNTFGNCVVGQTTNTQNVLNGVKCLLRGSSAPNAPNGCNNVPGEGECDDKFDSSPDGIDDFEDAMELFGGGTAPPSPNNLYTPRLCNEDGDISPRIITIFAVDQWLGSNRPMPIRYFLVMYVTGCEDKDGNLDKTCAGFPGPGFPPGHGTVNGIIVQAFVSDAGDVGPPNEGGVLTIALVE